MSAWWDWLQEKRREREALESERRGVDFQLGHDLLTDDEYAALAARRDALDVKLR